VTHKAALGFRAHSGWAAVVALGGLVAAPIVLRRRRVELADRAIAGSAQLYHAAEQMQFASAAEFVEQCSEASNALAARALRETIAEVSAKGYTVGAACVLLSSARPLPELKGILASHALIHTAEGEFYRGVLSVACVESGLKTSGLKEKELWSAAGTLNFSRSELETRISELGKSVGPPWRQDEKLCALASWIALSTLA